MTLYLSRLQLNPAHPQTTSELDRPYELQRAISVAFADLQKSRVLFRAERERPGKPMVLVQSLVEPRWDMAREKLPHVQGLDVRPFTLSGVENGARLKFRLLCRPTKRITEGGSRVILKSSEDLFAWLRRKGESGGFVVEEAGFDRSYWLDSRTDVRGSGHGVNPSRTPALLRSREKGEPMLGSVRFDGLLAVTDAESLRLTVAQGIGTQKAFGFGLLSLSRV